MAMVTYYDVLCNCGHNGQVILKENDTPYSSDNWERYSLVELDGSANNYKSWQDFFSLNSISCPNCKAKLTDKNIK
jgi:hypothetical protein